MRELLYRKISVEIAENIINGSFTEGSRLPGVRELAAQWDASANTVLKALDELEAGGYIRKNRGQGIFIEPKSSWTKSEDEEREVELILYDLDTPFNRMIISTIEKASTDSGYKLNIQSSNLSIDIGNSSASIIVPTSVGSSESGQDNIDPEMLPRIYIGEFSPPRHFPFSYLVIDSYGGFFHAAEMLLASGRERIAYIGASSNIGSTPNLEDEPGWNALRDVLTGTSLGFNREYAVTAGGWDPGLGMAAMDRLLFGDEFPDAVICANDSLAAGVYKSCRAAGLSIPDDVAVIGAGDQDIAALLDPPLTSLKFPAAVMGLTAVNYIKAAADGKLDNTELMRARLDMRLVIRDSALNSLTSAGSSVDESIWL